MTSQIRGSWAVSVIRFQWSWAMIKGYKNKAPPLLVSWSWKSLGECPSIRKPAELPDASVHPDLIIRLPLSWEWSSPLLEAQWSDPVTQCPAPGRGTPYSLALVSSEETCIRRRTLKSCCCSSYGAQCHRGCPGSMESPLKTLSVPWLPNKCQHRAHAQLQSSFESLLLAHIWCISFLTSQSTARGQSGQHFSLKSGHHLTVKHICYSVNKYLLSPIWAPEFGLQVNLLKANLLRLLVAWFSFCHHNSILRNVHLVLSLCSHTVADAGARPQEGDWGAERGEI